MKDLIKQVYYNGYKINIYPNDMAEGPDEWKNEERFMVFDHRDFCVKRKGFEPQDIFDNKGKVPGYFVYACYAYIHSGVALSVGNNMSWPDQRWDVSFKGFWLIKRTKGTWTEAKARIAAEGLCKDWNQYLSGEVYGFMIEDEDENEEGGCWGYYGDEKTSGLLSDAQEEIDGMIEDRINEILAENKRQDLVINDL